MTSYSITSADYLEHQQKSFCDIRLNEELFDVTLACIDYTMKAHKVVLASSSQFFREVFKQIENPNPFIFLKGLEADDLHAILDFIYTGETKVEMNHMQRFIDGATELKIYGIMSEEVPIKKEHVVETINISGTDVNVKEKLKKYLDKSKEQKSNVTSKGKNEKNDDIHEETYSGFSTKDEGESLRSKDLEVLEYEIQKLITSERNEFGKKVSICKECGKMFQKKSKAKLHVEIHISGFSHKCEVCGTIAKSKKALMNHKYIKHTKKDNIYTHTPSM